MKAMRTFNRAVAKICFALAISMTAVALPVEPLTDAKCVELRKQLLPAADEPWRTIPWKIALLDAQRAAAQQNKPIFIWAMDGHPLGCT